MIFCGLILQPLFAEDDEMKEKSPWEFTAGFGGTESVNTGNSADTFYWGPFGKVGYEFSDPLRARFTLRHTRDKFLYDGLGGIAKQSSTGFTPGINWEIAETFSVDAEYTHKFGENDFRENSGTLALEFTGINILRLGVDASVSQQNYIFPTTETKVALRNFATSLEAAIIVSRQVEIPLLFSYMSSRYNTNSSLYSARTFTPGVTYRTQDRAWSFTGAAVVGSDSSNYSILGLEARVRFRATEHVSFRVSGSINRYNYSAVKTLRGAKAVTAADSVSPLGNSETFEIGNLGFEAAYAF